MWDILLLDCHAATMAQSAKTPCGAIHDAAIAIEQGRIAWVGAAKDRPKVDTRETRRLDGMWVTPGLIDCHTHLVFAGERVREWAMRQAGASYQQIAEAGGGILATVRATRACSEDQLVRSAARRARTMAAQGVTSIEIKSGYGLDLPSEIKILRAAAQVGTLANVHVSRTFLGAHAIPPEFAADRQAYVALLCEEMIPAVAQANLADACDAFCETFAFTAQETRRILTAAKAHGLRIKLHAEQLSDQGGAELAAELGALSADHLEHLSATGIAAMARSGTVAVLLPGAYYFMGETRKPPVAALRRARVPIAIATDCNPGTSPIASPRLALNMACTLFQLTPEEALVGMTRHAAKALGQQESIGTLEAGKFADLAIWNISEPAELAYWLGADLLRERYLHGRPDKLGTS
jgi:imidazolonepropionase